MYKNKKIFAVLPAAGSGKRMQCSENKLWLEVDGCSVIERTLRVFAELKIFDALILVIREDEQERFAELIKKFDSVLPIHTVNGGAERQDSVLNGLRFLRERALASPKSIVMVHDAARMLVTSELLLDSVEGALKYRAVGVGVPVKDTIKQVNKNGFIVATPERSTLWAIHTPQTFEFELLLRSYELLTIGGKTATDDCQAVEKAGYDVKMLMGSYENIKITTPDDLGLAAEILRRRENANRSGV